MSAGIQCSDDVLAAFRDVMGGAAASVTIGTASDARFGRGMTATSVTSMEPAPLPVCSNDNTLLHAILLRARRFCANVLRSAQSDEPLVYQNVTSCVSVAAPAAARCGRTGLP